MHPKDSNVERDSKHYVNNIVVSSARDKTQDRSE